MRKHCILGCCFRPFVVAVLLLLLQLATGEQQAEDHRIQRRFMWQQMDNSVMGGLMGRMFSGARAMRSMFGDFLPSTANYGKTMVDYMPTETTRVKYIIRDPHTNKPVKIIKMRGSQKKVVKLIRPLPKPVVTEPTKLQYENRMRQLEKEQELIVEGKVPMSSDEALMDKYFKQKPRTSSNEIVAGKIMEYQSWKPVYKAGEQPTSFVTIRPQPLTQLHTQITASHDHRDHHDHHEYRGVPMGDMLPKPEKLLGNRPELDEEDDDFEQVEDENELSKPPGHQYEVTEHTGEASGEVQSLAPLEGGFVPSKQYVSHPSSHHSKEHFSHPSSQHSKEHFSEISSHHSKDHFSRPSSHHSKEHFSHSSSHHSKEHFSEPSSHHSKEHHSQYSNHNMNSNADGSHHSSSSQSRTRGRGMTPLTTTTTEAPNYPPSFLKKYRERENVGSTKSSSSKSRAKQHKELILTDNNPPSNVSFAMSSLRARLLEQQRQSKQQEHDAEMEAALVDAMHGDKWPAEVESGGSYLTSPIGPSAVAFEQPMEAAKVPRSEYKRQRANLRQRGSIKFSDNPGEEV